MRKLGFGVDAHNFPHMDRKIAFGNFKRLAELCCCPENRSKKKKTRSTSDGPYTDHVVEKQAALTYQEIDEKMTAQGRQGGNMANNQPKKIQAFTLQGDSKRS